MKLRGLLVGCIFMFCGMVSHAQVYEMFYNGFETNEAGNYTVSPDAMASFDSQVQTSGDRSLKLSPSTLSDVSLILDTLDFSLNSNLTRYATFLQRRILRLPRFGTSVPTKEITIGIGWKMHNMIELEPPTVPASNKTDSSIAFRTILCGRWIRLIILCGNTSGLTLTMLSLRTCR